MQPPRPVGQPEIRIDLYSDTSTLPTPEMRDYMCRAEVGDEQKGEDPTVNELQDMVAKLLGKEAAVFLPSGTMCNQIAFAVHCNPGDLVLVDRSAHPLISESGGTAVMASCTLYPIDGERGQYTPEQMQQIMDAATRYWPGISGISVEQTTNRPGGFIWPLEQMRAVCAFAREQGAFTHMDGARLLNAVVATGIPATEYTATFDSVWIDLSKGLGAPVGGVLAGSSDFIGEAWQWKQRIGGAMRQAGIVAAAGIVALEKMVDRLVKDHEHARLLCEGLSTIEGISPRQPPRPTNFVMVNTRELGYSSAELKLRLESEGVRSIERPPHDLRLVIHRHIGGEDLEYTIEAFRRMQ